MQVPMEELLRVIGEKEVKLGYLIQHATQLEGENAQLKETIEKMASEMEQLRDQLPAPDEEPPSEDEIASARQEAGE